jgi:hypothetical protein
MIAITSTRISINPVLIARNGRVPAGNRVGISGWNHRPMSNKRTTGRSFQALKTNFYLAVFKLIFNRLMAGRFSFGSGRPRFRPDMEDMNEIIILQCIKIFAIM